MANKQMSFGKNLVRGLKGFAVGFVAGLIMLVAFWLSRYLMNLGLLGVGLLLSLGFLLLYFVVWGYLAYKFFKWK